MAQTWEDLLFAHWRVPVEALRRVVPSEIPIGTWDGGAWIGVTPFGVAAVRLRRTPHVPGATSFAEVNARTYATIDGRPGIYFRSLDAASRYRAAGAVAAVAPGSLEHFLTERYCLYTLDHWRRVQRADIHHPPWPLQAAQARWSANSMTAGLGLELPAADPLLHFSARQDVLIWPIRPIA